MDLSTMETYERDARAFCARYRLIAPTEVLQFAQAFFYAGQPTADIGCGSGRDVAWLAAQGYPATGYDASPAMLAEARRAYPAIDVYEAALPDLAGVPDAAYANVLCSATLMHVRQEDLITAILSLSRILQAGGRLLLSYRTSATSTEREADGRLFTTIPPGKLTLLLESVGLQVVITRQDADSYRPQVQWHTLLAEKRPTDVARGLERLQAVLAQDRKVATYKLALIRALCVISRTESSRIRWGEGVVYVPMWAIAVQWLIAYWPLITAPMFIAQKRGEKLNGPQPIAFRATIQNLAASHGVAGLADLLAQLDDDPERFRAPLKVIADTIRDGPVTHAGTSGPRLFSYIKDVGSVTAGVGQDGSFGWVVVPEMVWLDLSRFDHWIEDSVVVRWARLTAEMNAEAPQMFSTVVPLLLATPNPERTTSAVRTLLLRSPVSLECVWSGRVLTTRFEVDHMVPYAVWGNNDVWNLLPADPKVNNAKRDALPTRALLMRRRDCIVDYWQRYAAWTPERFKVQIERALGCRLDTGGWERQAFAGLQETIERLATTRGLARWEP